MRVDDVVLKAMDEEPERRYQEARAVKEDVEILGTGRRRPGAGRRSRIVLATGTALAMLLLLVQAGRRGWFARPRGAGAGAPEIATMTLPDEHGRLSLPGATGKVTVSAFDPIVLDRRPGLGLDHDVDVAVVGGGLPRAAYRDGQDRLHFSFPFRGDLSRASHWASFSLEKAGATYRHLSLAVWKGRPILAYETIDGGNLMVAVADSATPLGPSDWKLVTVDSAGDRVGNSNRVHVFSSGVVGISYSDYAHGHLKYAWSADPADAASWRTVVVHRRPEAETVSHFGFRSRLTEVHGFPAILYASFPEDGLYYVRARDPDGSQWEADDIRDLGRPSRQSGWVNQWRRAWP